MGFSSVDGNRPDCRSVDPLLFRWAFRTPLPSACLGNSAWFRLRYGSLSPMRPGLVVQDSYVHYSPVVDPSRWRRRNGFICLPKMWVGYWIWIARQSLTISDAFL